MELDLLFEVTPGHRKVTDVVEYGNKLSDIMSGNLPGPNSACFDIHVLADITGKLTGTTKAIITMSINPDGTTTIKLHESLSLTDGEVILMEGFGVSLPGESQGMVEVKGAFKFYTTSKEYAWVNSTIAAFEAWGDPTGSNFNLKAFSVQ